MKHTNRLHMPPTDLVMTSHLLDTIKYPLSECEILDIQNKFLSNGFQHIKVKNIRQGRAVVKRFLSSMGMYHDITCLTLSDIPLSKNVCNLYHELLFNGYLDHDSLQFLEEFFIDEFYFDFMWIEASRKLLTSSWFKFLEKKLINFKLEQHLPMIVISTEQE